MNALLELLFPLNCAGCDRPGTPLCPACLTRIQLIDPAHACPACGAPAGDHCSECRGAPFTFAAARCATMLEPPVSRAIVLLKDGAERRYARLLGSLLAESAGDWFEPGDVLVPVPASPAAVRKRGFDHALDIARALGDVTSHRVTRALQATGGLDQRGLTREERFENRRLAFRVTGRVEVPKQLVLIDDVLTTGATLDAAAAALLSAGAERVRALAVARSCSPRPAVKYGAAPATLLMLSPGSVVAGAERQPSP